MNKENRLGVESEVQRLSKKDGDAPKQFPEQSEGDIPRFSIGEFFLKRYREMEPDVAVPDEPIRQAIRVNTQKTTAEKLIWKLTKQGVETKKIPWLPDGYWVNAEFSLASTKEYLLGHFYIQGPLSQLACVVLNPEKDSTILDMAAAPGSKTTYLAQMVPDGVVVALDLDAIRLEAVRNNAERLGLPNVITIRKDARFARDLKKEFTHVLLDAPCAGNFCSEPGWSGKRSLDDLKKNARVQRDMIVAAYRSLGPGGKLLYSTCSLEPEENELIVDWVLKKFDDLKVVPLKFELGDSGITKWNDQELDTSIGGTKRFWPHKTGEEGFYMALLERRK